MPNDPRIIDPRAVAMGMAPELVIKSLEQRLHRQILLNDLAAGEVLELRRGNKVLMAYLTLLLTEVGDTEGRYEVPAALRERVHPDAYVAAEPPTDQRPTFLFHVEVMPAAEGEPPQSDPPNPASA